SSQTQKPKRCPASSSVPGGASALLCTRAVHPPVCAGVSSPSFLIPACAQPDPCLPVPSLIPACAQPDPCLPSCSHSSDLCQSFC
ncbi:unnamed protein product, partial [Coccothraustes coccothraustes]